MGTKRGKLAKLQCELRLASGANKQKFSSLDTRDEEGPLVKVNGKKRRGGSASARFCSEPITS